METRANYVAIGGFVILVIACAFAALFWLYRAGDSGVTATMRVVFPEAVTGLSTGGSVLFNGIRVGEVTRLEFPPNGGDNVIAVTRVDATAPIKIDTGAQLASQGLTGVSYISLTGGTGESLFAPEQQVEGQIPTLEAKQSTFTNVVDNLQSVLGRLDTTLTQVNQLVSENRGNVTGIVDNVRTITGDIAAATPQVAGLIDDVSAAGRAFAAAAPQVTTVVDRVNGLLAAVEPARIGSIVGNADAFAATLPELSRRAQDLAGTANGIVVRLQDGADRLGEALTNVRDVTARVDPEAVGAIVGNVRAATDVFASRSGAIGTLVDNVTAVSGDVRRLAGPIADRSEAVAKAIDDASALVGDARSAVQAATPAIEGVGRAIGAIDPARITGIVDDVETVTTMLATEAPNVSALLNSAQEAAKSVQGVAATVAGRNGAIERALDNGADLIADLREAARTAPQLVASANRLIDTSASIIDSVDRNALDGILRDAARLTGTFAARADDFGDIIVGARGIVARGEAIASALAQRTPQIGVVIDNIEAASGSLRVSTAALPGLAERLQPAVENIAAVLEAVDPAAIQGIVGDVRSFTGTVAAQTPVVERVLRSADAALADAQAVAANARTLTDDVVGKRAAVLAAVDDAAAAVASARRAADGLPGLVDTLQPGLENASAALSAIDPAAVSDIITQARTLATAAGAQAPQLARIVASVEGTTARVEAIASAVAQRTPQIGAVFDNVEAATASARTVAARAPELLDALQPGVANLSEALSAVDPAAVRAIVAEARGLAETVGRQRPALERIVASVDAFAGTVAAQAGPLADLVRSAGGTAARLEAVASAVAQRTPQIGAAIDNVEAASRSVRDAAAAAPELVDTLRPGVENVAEVLQAIDPAAITAIVDQARGLATTLGAQTPQIEAIIGSARGITERVEAVTSALAQRTPQVGASIDNIEAATVAARRAAEQARALLETIRPGLENVNEALAAVDPAAIRAIVTDAKTLADTAAAQGPRLSGIVDKVDAAVGDARAIAGDVRAQLPTLTAAVGDVRAVASDARQATQRLPALMDRLEPGLDAAARALQAIDPDTVATILTNVSDLTTSLAASRSDIVNLVQTAGSAVRKVDEITAAMQGKIDVVTGAIDDVAKFAREVGAAAPDIDTVVGAVTDAAQTLRNAVAAVDPEAVRSIVSDIRSATSAIGSRAGQIGSAIDNVFASAKDLAEGLGTVGGENGVLKEVLERARNIVANVDAASGKLGSLIERANLALGERLDVAYTGFNNATGAVERLAAAIEPRVPEITNGLARFSTGGLDDLRAVLTQARSTLSAIESAVSSFDRNPSRVIFGGGDDAPTYSPKRR